MSKIDRRLFLTIVAGGALAGCQGGDDEQGPIYELPGPLNGGDEIKDDWRFQAASEIPAVDGVQLSGPQGLSSMSRAVVPGTPLTSMIENGKYPDPFYGRIVTKEIPDTLKDTDYWYRAVFGTGSRKQGQRFWLRFEGINYIATVWLNGVNVGTIEGAFMRGVFDVTDAIGKYNGNAYLAVRIQKLDYSEGPLHPSYTSGLTRGRRNGGPTGETLKNGPTFFCTAGWDWLPTIPDRDLGIWQPVYWSTTGAARIANLRVDPTVSSDLGTADLQLEVELDCSAKLTGFLIGQIGKTTFKSPFSAEKGTTTLKLTSANIPQLKLLAPKLWWPNGYGDPYLYTLSLKVEIGNVISDENNIRFGVRKIEYSRKNGNDTQLAITVNNQPILIMGGNWGLDEALKRIPRSRLFNQVKLHRNANLNLIRNWNGQSTSRDFYDACDEYGILVWQDFFYSTEGPAPVNRERDIANIRDCIIRYRNHPSILLWCGGNEGPPPQDLVDALDKAVLELDPKRACLTSSAGDTGDNAINGFSSGGPYHWTSPSSLFDMISGTAQVCFHNEMGSYSIPTLEFVQAMLPETSWECPDDYWADRDCNGNGGNDGGSGYIDLTVSRYGDIVNLADFIRKSQLMNYECIKAIYEAHAANMIGPRSDEVTSPSTGVIFWMTNPSQPSFVWQMYSHDLDQHSSLFAIRNACQRQNAIFNVGTKDLVVANHAAKPLSGNVTAQVYNLDGSSGEKAVLPVSGLAASSFRVIGNLGTQISAASSDVCFISLSLADASGAVLSKNFYWYDKSGSDSNYRALDTMKAGAISVSATAAEAGTAAAGVGTTTTMIEAKVQNIGAGIALMVHLQLFDKVTGLRILPCFYSQNYLNLLPGESTVVQIEIPHKKGMPVYNAAIRIDGWKLDRQASKLSATGVPVSFNENAMAVTGTKTFRVCN